MKRTQTPLGQETLNSAVRIIIPFLLSEKPITCYLYILTSKKRVYTTRTSVPERTCNVPKPCMHEHENTQTHLQTRLTTHTHAHPLSMYTCVFTHTHKHTAVMTVMADSVFYYSKYGQATNMCVKAKLGGVLEEIFPQGMSFH